MAESAITTEPAPSSTKPTPSTTEPAPSSTKQRTSLTPSNTKQDVADSSPRISPVCPVCPDPTQQAHVYVKLFLHSLAMFTLPFVSYFFARRFVTEEWDMTTEQGYIYGAIAAVVTVNVVIGSYVYQALTEDDYKQSSDHLHAN